MRVLLDTHAFLWWIMDDPQLSDRSREIISDGRNEILFSAASGWEIAIKARIGRLILPNPPDKFISEQIVENAFTPLAVQLSHALHVFHLPEHHKDPFDRLLISQCQLEGIPILTTDLFIPEYAVDVIW
ncbi:MAG: type II toxin-antitoxin system VapC family toxin [Anaerolineaceae bacterium]|nr:type II toxin-antitoxin system VapC family toxin [Anaerolineaceae bacterium]